MAQIQIKLEQNHSLHSRILCVRKDVRIFKFSFSFLLTTMYILHFISMYRHHTLRCLSRNDDIRASKFRINSTQKWNLNVSGGWWIIRREFGDRVRNQFMGFWPVVLSFWNHLLLYSSLSGCSKNEVLCTYVDDVSCICSVCFSHIFCTGYPVLLHDYYGIYLFRSYCVCNYDYD